MEVKFDRMKFHWNFIDEISRNFTEISSCLKWTMKFHRYVNLYFLWYLLHLTTSVSVDHQFGQICQLLCLFGPFWDSGIDRHNLPQLKDIFTNSPRESPWKLPFSCRTVLNNPPNNQHCIFPCILILLLRFFSFSLINHASVYSLCAASRTVKHGN